MYNSYTKPKDNQIYISLWDGDCWIYTVFDTEEEKQEEVNRRKKIDEEAKEKHRAYLEYLESLEK